MSLSNKIYALTSQRRFKEVSSLLIEAENRKQCSSDLFFATFGACASFMGRENAIDFLGFNARDKVSDIDTIRHSIETQSAPADHLTIMTVRNTRARLALA